MIVGWSPSSPSTFADWSYGLTPDGVIASRSDVNSLLRDLDLEVPRRLVSGALFDMRYLGSVEIQVPSVVSPSRGEAFAVGVNPNPDIYRIDPFLGAVDTGLDGASTSAAVIGGRLLASGEAVFWCSSVGASDPTATYLHTNFSSVTTINNGGGGSNFNPADYRYSATYGRYYRTVQNAGVRTAQYSASMLGSWTDLPSTSAAVHLDLNPNFPYLAVIMTSGSTINLKIFNDTTELQSISGNVVGVSATYSVPVRCWFYQDRLYILARNTGSTFWCILRSGKASGSVDLSANLVDLEIVKETPGSITGMINPSVGQFITTFNNSSSTFWSIDGLSWNQETFGAAVKIAGDQLYTPKSVSRFI